MPEETKKVTEIDKIEKSKGVEAVPATVEDEDEITGIAN